MLTCDETIEGVDSKLEELSRVHIEWFTQKFMQANASKFQYIMFGSTRVSNCNFELKLEGAVTLRASSCLWLLGVDVDQNLLFSEHVGRICKQGGKKLNVLCRISDNLCCQQKRS